MSLDIIELVLEVETTFGVVIWDSSVAQPASVGELYDCVARKLDPVGRTTPTGTYSGELWERYLDALERGRGIDRRRLVPEALFVRDLGLD